MRVLIITRQYFPHGDATSNVVHNLAKEFANRNWDVQVLALTSYKTDAEVHIWEGIPVENIYLPCSIDRAQIKKEWKKYCIRTALATAQRFYSLAITKGVKECRELEINLLFRNAFAKKIEEYQNKEEYDLCIATLMPVEAVSAAMNVCAKDIVFAIYQLDTYWNNDWLPEEYQNARKQYEKYLIDNVDYIITTPLIKKNKEETFPNHKGKIISAEFPLITASETRETKKKYDDNKIHCVFLGRLYNGVRPPELAIETILKTKDSNVVFDFYGTGQHLINMVLEKEGQSGNKIKLHGIVSSAEAREIQDNSHFLVNIDNTTALQVPSKIFEYMCTGKPIINFYFFKDSPTLKYMEKYPNCVNIYLNGNLYDEAKKLEEFIETNKETRIPYSIIKETFRDNTPEYVVDLFYKEYNESSQQKESI